MAPVAHPNNHQPVCHSQQFPAFSGHVWDTSRWQRSAPKPSAVQAAQHIFRCARHPFPLRRKWERDRLAFGRYRQLRQVAPYPGGGTWWAIPWYIVSCESGGDWMAANPTSDARGPYELLDQGEPYPAVTWKQKMENHRIAADLYAESGAAPWVCG